MYDKESPNIIKMRALENEVLNAQRSLKHRGNKELYTLFEKHWKGLKKVNYRVVGLEAEIVILRRERTLQEQLEKEMKAYLKKAVQQCDKESNTQIKWKKLEAPESSELTEFILSQKKAFDDKYKRYVRKLVKDVRTRAKLRVQLNALQTFLSVLREECERGGKGDPFEDFDRPRGDPKTRAYKRLNDRCLDYLKRSKVQIKNLEDTVEWIAAAKDGRTAFVFD